MNKKKLIEVEGADHLSPFELKPGALVVNGYNNVFLLLSIDKRQGSDVYAFRWFSLNDNRIFTERYHIDEFDDEKYWTICSGSRY